jgi:hypothetical protein
LTCYPDANTGSVYVVCDNDKASFLVAFDASTGDEMLPWWLPYAV